MLSDTIVLANCSDGTLGRATTVAKLRLSDILYGMSQSPWQIEVAQLFEYAAQCLREHHERQAIVAFGTAIAYLQRAQNAGERTASELLAQFSESERDGQTQRFKFAPGELEELMTRDRDK